MKTIEPPITLPVYRIRCSNLDCKALLEVEHKELSFTPNQKDGDFYSFNCPHCNKRVTIDATVLPRLRVEN